MCDRFTNWIDPVIADKTPATCEDARNWRKGRSENVLPAWNYIERELPSFSPVISCVRGDKLQILYCFRAKKFYLREILLQETEVRAALRQLSRFEYAIEYAYLVVHANNRFCCCRNIVTVIIVTIIIVTVEILSVSRNFVRLPCLSSFFFPSPFILLFLSMPLTRDEYYICCSLGALLWY